MTILPKLAPYLIISLLLAIPIFAKSQTVATSQTVDASQNLPDPHALEHDFADELINAFASQDKQDVADELELAHSRSNKKFRKLVVIVARGNNGSPGYWANLWLACRGDRPSLLRLFHGYKKGYFEMGSQEWSEAYNLWGIFKFYPASEVLLETSSNSNLVAGHTARNLLKLLYPEIDQDKLDWSKEYTKFEHIYKNAIHTKQIQHPELFLSR